MTTVTHHHQAEPNISASVSVDILITVAYVTVPLGGTVPARSHATVTFLQNTSSLDILTYTAEKGNGSNDLPVFTTAGTIQKLDGWVSAYPSWYAWDYTSSIKYYGDFPKEMKSMAKSLLWTRQQRRCRRQRYRVSMFRALNPQSPCPRPRLSDLLLH